MALATKQDAERELASAELKISNFLVSVNSSGLYTPLTSNHSIQSEIDGFCSADWREKAKLMQSYMNLYQEKPLSSVQKELLTQANMSVLIGKLVNLGLPTEIFNEDHPKQQKQIQTDYHKETISCINKLRSMKNFDKCQHQGKPLSHFLSTLQFSPTYAYTKRDYETVKKHYDNLERYNQALDIISDLEKKAFPIAYRQEFAYKVAQTVKESKGTCSENQLNHLLKAHNKLLGREGIQLDMTDIMLQNKSKKMDFSPSI